jgi:YebC/PmpR family DNA-binding regulatory protein
MGRAFEYRKATKFARWDKMAKAFTKAGRDISIAVKGGGGDPDTNAALRRAIQNAKSVQMPKDRIEAAIKKASDKDTSNFDEITYEGMGPHGVAIVVDTATDNSTRTVANVRAVFNKKGGTLGMQGMHDFIFTKKAVFKIKASAVEDAEALELELIDFGLDSIEKTEDGEFYELQSAFTDFGNLQHGLETLKIEVEQSEMQRIPTITKELSEEQMDEVLEFVDKLEELDDVQNVYHNLA